MKTSAIALLLFAVGAANAAELPQGAIQWPAEAQAWKPGPPAMPAGTQIQVLEGDPKSAGMFTLRLKVPADRRIAPHWHPQPERVTVLSGAALVGFGERRDAAELRRFGAGSFYVNPPNVPHFVEFTEETVVQITGQGPWEVRTLDSGMARWHDNGR